MKYFSIDEMVRSATAKKYGIDNRPSEDILNNLVLFIEKVLDPIREQRLVVQRHQDICMDIVQIYRLKVV